MIFQIKCCTYFESLRQSKSNKMQYFLSLCGKTNHLKYFVCVSLIDIFRYFIQLRFRIWNWKNQVFRWKGHIFQCVYKIFSYATLFRFLESLVFITLFFKAINFQILFGGTDVSILLIVLYMQLCFNFWRTYFKLGKPSFITLFFRAINIQILGTSIFFNWLWFFINI